MSSPYTPDEEHHISSPIWDSSINCIEVFYSEESNSGDLVHAMIERKAPTSRTWKTFAAVPGTSEPCTVYTTKEIAAMIDNSAERLERRRTPRATNSHSDSGKVRQAMVYSVRIKYKGRQFFLDRNIQNWCQWSGGSLCLSTTQIKDVLGFYV